MYYVYLGVLLICIGLPYLECIPQQVIKINVLKLLVQVWGIKLNGKVLKKASTFEVRDNLATTCKQNVNCNNGVSCIKTALIMFFVHCRRVNTG